MSKKTSKSGVKKQVAAGMDFCARMNEIGIGDNWFDPDKADAFLNREFILIVDRSGYPGFLYGTPSPRLVNPENQSEVLA